MNGSAPEYVPSVVAEEPQAELCRCDRPIPRERAEHKWAARTYCVRCGLDVPLRWR
ncbi:MAG: hypothetical protein ACXVZ4_13215 [Gaiellaceae bacterium]